MAADYLKFSGCHTNCPNLKQCAILCRSSDVLCLVLPGKQQTRVQSDHSDLFPFSDIDINFSIVGFAGNDLWPGKAG